MSSDKIENLTKTQIDLFPKYGNKWLKIGLSCDPFSYEEARELIDPLYKEILGRTPPKVIIIMDNPITLWVAVLLLSLSKDQKLDQVESQVRNQVENQVWNQVGDQVRNQVENQVWDQVRNQVRNQVWNQVENQVKNQVWNQVENQVWNQVENQVKNQVRDQVWNQVWNQVENQVGDQVRDQVWDQVWDQVRNLLPNFVWPYLDGQFWASYISFYDFFFSEVLHCKCPTWSISRDLSRLSLIYPLDDFCVLCQKPISIKMVDGVLHNDDGPAIEYTGDFKVWALNGTNVPQWLVETKAEDIDPNQVLKLDNAQQRAEGVRKVGIERLWYKCCKKVLDKKGDYELGLIPVRVQTVSGRLVEGDWWPWLKMKNPSVPELWHVEGIPDKECETVEEALHSRKPNKMKKIPISGEGEDWYQQGDVYVWPRKAKSLKPLPSILT